MAKPSPAQDNCARHCWNRLSTCQRWGAVVAIIGVFAIIVLLCWSAFGYYGAMSENGKDAAVTDIPRKAQLYRDIAILCLTVIGMAMVAWRSYSLNKQANAANKQAKTAADQFALANDRLYSDQFASAAESMSKESKDGKSLIAARISGIYIMADLAIKLPAEFAERVVINLIAYIKDNARRKSALRETLGIPDITMRIIGGDVKAAFSVLSDILRDKAIDIDEKVLDFSQCDFSGLDFQGIDLSHYTKWTETNFTECDLSGVRFADGANMQRANFSGARLQGAKLRGTNLSHANLRGANLVSTNMLGCHMRHAKLQQTDDGKNTDMENAGLVGANLENANLGGANINYADFRGAVLFCADLTGVQNLLNAKLDRTYMRGAVIDNSVRFELSERAKYADQIIWLGTPKRTGQINNRPNTASWQLEKCADGYALAGILFNFACLYFYPENVEPWIGGAWTLPGEPENIQRQAAMLEKVPEDTPDEIKAWLKEIKAQQPK